MSVNTQETSGSQPRRSCRIVMRKSLDEFNSARKDGDAEAEIQKIMKNVPAREEIVETTVEEQVEKAPPIPPKISISTAVRRFQSKYPRNEPVKKRKKEEEDELPTDYEELKQKTESGEIPATVFYRATSNSMYIPSITADMIQDNGTSLTVTTDRKDYFKYVRVRQKTKVDHAEPDRVFEVIDAVRRRPIIWDQRLLCHQNIILVRRAWQQIDAELGNNDEYPLIRRKQIWKNKKDYYSLAANTASLQKWMFADAMEFYRPMVRFRSTVCLRPTVPAVTSSGEEQPRKAANLFDRLVLANKTVSCGHTDKENVMTFLLKSLHESGMACPQMMEAHRLKILEIFQKNFEKIDKRYVKIETIK